MGLNIRKIGAGIAGKAKIIGTVAGAAIGGAVGGPAGATLGAKVGGLAGTGVQTTHDVIHAKNASGGGTIPSRAGSIEEARGQDKARMKKSYGYQ